MRRGIGERKDHRPLVHSRHRAHDAPVERAAYGAEPDERGRAELLDRRDQIGHGRSGLREGPLVFGDRLAVARDEAAPVDEEDTRARVLVAKAFATQRLGEEARDPGRRRARAEEEETLVRETAARDPERSEDARERDRGRPLDVVVEAAHAVAVARQEPHRIRPGPVLELNAALGELGLHRRHELLDERVELFARRARPAETEVERIGEERLVVGSRVDEHGQRVLGGHAAHRGVERELADRDPHTVRAQVPEAQDALAARHDDEADVALGPVSEDLADPAAALDRQVEPTGPPHDVAEAKAGLAHRRRVHERQEPAGIGHEDPIEERLVGVLELREVDVPLEIGRLRVELRHRASQLRLKIVDALGKQPEQAESLALVLVESRGLVQPGVVEQGRAARRGHALMM